MKLKVNLVLNNWVLTYQTLSKFYNCFFTGYSDIPDHIYLTFMIFKLRVTINLRLSFTKRLLVNVLNNATNATTKLTLYVNKDIQSLMYMELKMRLKAPNYLCK